MLTFGSTGTNFFCALHTYILNVSYISHFPSPLPTCSLSNNRFVQLYNMETRPKSDPAFEALGSMDELNASLAIAAEHSALAGNGLSDMLATIQSLLMDASALVATPRDSSSARKISRTGFPTWCTDQLEVA